MKLYVGNISPNTKEDDLRKHFEGFGEVLSVAIITDRDTGSSRGFGFVEMPNSAAQAAIKQSDGHELDGYMLAVNQARERQNSGGYSGNSGHRSNQKRNGRRDGRF